MDDEQEIQSQRLNTHFSTLKSKSASKSRIRDIHEAYAYPLLLSDSAQAAAAPYCKFCSETFLLFFTEVHTTNSETA